MGDSRHVPDRPVAPVDRWYGSEATMPLPVKLLQYYVSGESGSNFREVLVQEARAPMEAIAIDLLKSWPDVIAAPHGINLFIAVIPAPPTKDDDDG